MAGQGHTTGQAACRDCADVIETIAKEASLVCRDRWGVLQAMDHLRDGYEARQIAEVDEAGNALIDAMMTAASDGEITPGELQEIKVRFTRLRREIGDVETYDLEENELHARAHQGELKARAHSAQISRVFDEVDAAINYRQGGGLNSAHPWSRVQHAQREQLVSATG
ncbi:MAG TPA: hypothetical protein VM487_15890 [Phycisphaerae bacterium]|nr:hypothetical protein [Phycisphaerae bacterium]